MKKAILILVLAAFAVVYYLGFLTQKDTLPFAKEFFSAETPPSERIWGGKGTPLLEKDGLNQLYQLKLENAIRNLPMVSFFLMREAERVRKKGDSERSVELAAYSVKISPDMPQARFALAKAHWRQNPFRIGKVFFEFYEGQMARLREFRSSLHIAYGLFYVLSNAMLMTFMIFGLVVIIRYLPLYYQTIRRDMGRGIGWVLLNSLKVFVLFVPFILRLDILWAILFWAILLWGYATKWEKRFLIVFLILLVYLPFFLHSASAYVNDPSFEIVLEINRANNENPGKETEEELRTWLSSHPEDPEVIFTLGLMAKRRGQYDQAEELYQKAIQLNPRFSEALSNLGNTFLAQKRLEPAIDAYQQAIQFKPKAAYYYNLHQAYAQESILSKKTEEAFQKARQLDPDLVDTYEGIDSPHLRRLLIDETLPAKSLWARSLNLLTGTEGFLFRLLMGWFDPVASDVPFFVPAVFLGLLLAMSRLIRKKRLLAGCPLCGTATYRLYSGGVEHEFICFSCYRIFVQKEKLHARVEERKSFQVRRFQEENQRIGRLVSLFFSGFGYLWKEVSLKGFLFLFLFFIFLLKFVYWEGVIPDPAPSYSLSVWRVVFWGGLFLLFYIFSFRGIYLLKPRVETGK